MLRKNLFDMTKILPRKTARAERTIIESLNSGGYSVDPLKCQKAKSPPVARKVQIDHKGLSMIRYRGGSSLATLISHKKPMPYAGKSRPSRNSQFMANPLSKVSRCENSDSNGTGLAAQNLMRGKAA